MTKKHNFSVLSVQFVSNMGLQVLVLHKAQQHGFGPLGLNTRCAASMEGSTEYARMWNPRERCYMNAALQVLHNNTAVRDTILACSDPDPHRQVLGATKSSDGSVLQVPTGATRWPGAASKTTASRTAMSSWFTRRSARARASSPIL